MLVAHAALVDKLPVVIADLKAEAKAKYLPEPVKPAAPKSTSTPNPAAQAIPTREESKAKGAKGKTTPAAHARAIAPKTSKAEATAQIAAALAEAEEDQIQAPAAQGNEAPAVAVAQPVDKATPKLKLRARAQAPDVAPAAHGNEAQPPLGGETAPATHGQAGADAETGAAMNGVEPLVVTVGMVLTVKETCDAVSWRGRKVTVTGVKGTSIKAREANKPPAHAERGTFFPEDLEAVQ